MQRNYLKITGAVVLAALSLGSCTKDLNRLPTNSTTADQAFSTPAGYKQALAKVYGAFALTGSSGSASSDLGGIDAGTSDFLRLYWNAQELSTGEAICAWGDPGVPDFHNMNWTSGNTILLGLYARCVYQITVCNSFLRQSTDALLTSRGITGKDAGDIHHYRAEARFLRAYQYWVLMDLFGNPPFVTEKDPVGTFLPPQIKRADLFNYVESELKSVDSSLAAPHQNEYGRADQAADWALLARMYLNAEVYTGKPRYTDAITYASKVINAGYSLMPQYKNLFLADNNLNNPEVILSINYDGTNTQNYGGTTFLVNGSISGDMNPASFGVPSGGWGGNRSTKVLPQAFGDYSGNSDKRAMFYGANLDIAKVSDFKQGLAVIKYRNITSTGALPPNAGTYCSIDFPLFRLGEMYLVYAEAYLRGGSGGDIATATGYINKLRERAYGNASGDITATDLTLPFILNERARELYWEGFRRTDLIRFGDFTSGSYLWPWKGGVASGTGVDPHFNLYPIPAGDLIANPHLQQNPGY
ncbi:MAG TPA: RagB/SusD family nutrient uptake outer membrane protein [Chitinophagaceae bacterium]